ncbi:MAG: aspartate/glutamate racemase family protein [Deltaproteobacteria bacterium]|nr:aspartate/glutamate racemase family protein [Deltaproteobacteria bacterium]
MRKIGLLAGLSWESSAQYYAAINRGVRERLGGNHSAELLMYSFDFEPIARAQHDGDWAEIGARLADAARRLEQAGADGIILCTNTMHLVAAELEAALTVPLLHIADPVVAAAGRIGAKKVALLGTRFTMEQAFLRDRFEQGGLEVIVPDHGARATIHRVIYDELCAGVVSERSQAELGETVAAQVARGAEAVVLGCTELPMIITAAQSAVPLFDTTALHAAMAVDFMLAPAP